MIDLSWGGFTNGSVPASAMTAVDSAGHMLEHVAASKFLEMRQACFDATGKWINVAPGADSANRTVAQQQVDWNWYQADTENHAAAAYPGTSNHGWARAVDITGYETAVSGWVLGKYVNVGPVWRWLMANMGRFGFSWDTGKASKESWHFESYNTPSATALAGGNATPIENTKPKKRKKLLMDTRLYYIPNGSSDGKQHLFIENGPGYHMEFTGQDIANSIHQERTAILGQDLPTPAITRSYADALKKAAFPPSV